MSLTKRRAVFLDRDGVLNVDTGYVYRKEDIQWIEGAHAAVKWCNDQGYMVVVITNQSGVARGYYGEQDIQTLHVWMNGELASQGAHIDAFYYCPHYPDGQISQYSMVCECRKPQPGLIKRAIAELNIDNTISLFIGDRPSDLQAAEAAGVRGFLFDGGNLAEFIKNTVKTDD